MDTLMEVPILGDLLRFFPGGEEEDTAETAAAEETATKEQATAEQATAEQATPEDADRTVTLGADSWPADWMIGAVSPKGRYPAGNPDAARSLTLNSPLWATVDADGATVQVSSREETNFGSLLADAMSYAAASSLVWQEATDLYSLPLISMVNGGRLLMTAPAGTTLDENNIAEYVEDSPLSLVVITGDKLNDVLNAALRGMFSAQDENYGAFFQVSGLRFTYQKTDGDFQVKQAWLAGLSGETEIDLHGTSTRLALVLPSDLLTAYGLDSAAGYTDYFAQPEGGVAPLNGAGEDTVQTVEAPALHTALLDLPKNCDADTLTLLLARQGTTGRILPVTADFSETTSSLSYEIPAGAPEGTIAAIDYYLGDHLVGQAFLTLTDAAVQSARLPESLLEAAPTAIAPAESASPVSEEAADETVSPVSGEESGPFHISLRLPSLALKIAGAVLILVIAGGGIYTILEKKRRQEEEALLERRRRRAQRLRETGVSQAEFDLMMQKRRESSGPARSGRSRAAASRRKKGGTRP